MSAAARPSVALILLRAEWFDTVVALPELVQAVEQDAAQIAARVGERLEVRHTWVVNSAPALQAAVAGIRSAEVDLFVLVFQVWSEDFYLRPLLEAIAGRPLAAWCFLPWRRLPEKVSFVQVLRGSGMVGAFESLGTLRNLGARFAFTYGAPDDPRSLADLETAARAARVRRLLREARIGLLPARNEQMQSTFVDEFRLHHELGPAVEYLSVGDLTRACASLSPGELDGFIQHLQASYPLRGVSAPTLAQAGRASLGLARLAAERRLGVLSFNDIAPETHAALGLRPALYPPLFDEAGALVGLEGDLGAATALFILHHLTGSPCLFAEFWFWDEVENIIVGGHAGPQNPALAAPGQAWISQDYEYAQSDSTEGAHLQFVARPGRVTLLQLRGTPGGWQAIAASGEALDSPPRLEGYPHAVIRLDAPIDRFARQVARVGSTQHWIMAYVGAANAGEGLAEVSALCELLGVPLEVIGSP
jgi:L-fucose isomerase-like protein